MDQDEYEEEDTDNLDDAVRDEYVDEDVDDGDGDSDGDDDCDYATHLCSQTARRRLLFLCAT